MTSLHLGETRIDLASGQAEGPSGPFTLPVRELHLLKTLAERAGDVVPRDGLGAGSGSRAADMAISRLRRSLGPAGARVVTVRGRGYRLDVDHRRPLIHLGWGQLDLPLRLVHIGDRRVELTEQQTLLLDRLSQPAGAPVARAILGQALWGAADPARLDLLVHRLRQRIEASPATPRFLVSVRGRGLVLLDARLASSRAETLPPQAPLLGRAEPQAQILELLDSPGRAQLHGPPGIGKSALARAAAAAWLAQDRRRRHHLVDLHGLETPTEAEARLAAALGMDDVSDDEALARSLAARGDLLLVLDGALPPKLGGRLVAMAESNPHLRLLGAARTTWSGVPSIDLAGLADAHAQALIERAAERSLGPTLGRIARRVDGNPLALELIGRGLRHATPQDIERRLAVPLTPLRRAWQAVLDTLAPAERDLALAASFFHRPFAPEDLAATAGVPPSPGLADSLVARSILQPTGPHLRLPNAAREVLAATLRKDGAARATRTRYQDACRAALAELVHGIEPRGGAALSAIEARWPDLRRSLDVGATGPADHPALLAALARSSAERIPKARALRFATDLTAAAAREDLSGGDRARCLQAVHFLRWSDLSRAEREAMLRTALDDAADDPVAAGSIAAELASIVAFSWGHKEARQLLRTHPLPDDAPITEVIRRHRHVGRLSIIAVRPSVGLARLRSGVQLAVEHGLPLLEARCRVALGQALSVGALDPEAEHHLRRSIALTLDHALPEERVRATLRLAQHLLRVGLRPESAELVEAALTAAVKAGRQRLEEQCVSTLGYLLIGARRLPEAIGHLDRAIELCERHGGTRSLFVSLANRGLALALAGRGSEARADLRVALDSLGGGGGWYRVLGLSYQAVAEGMDDVSCAASVGAIRELLADLDHPDGDALLEALTVLEELDRGALSAAAAADWAEAWSGGAEVEGVVLGIAAVSARYKEKGANQ